LIFSGYGRKNSRETKDRMLGQTVTCGVNLTTDDFSPLHTLPPSGRVKKD
jgi:hypothetical protein